MKVLLLGGTGAMGVYLGKLLSDKGVDTYITSRSDRANEYNITYIKGNARELSFTQKLAEEHWDAIVDFMVYDTETFKSRVSLLLNATSQYVYLSSSRVYAESKEKITEESPRLLDVTADGEYLKTDEYALTKARQENILQKHKMQNWTIIRPYITYGKERLQLGILEKELWLSRAIDGEPIIFSEDIISKTTTLTSGYDVARALVEIVGNQKAIAEVFHITNNSSITWREVLNIYLEEIEKYYGVKPKVDLLDLDKFMLCYDAPYQIKYDRLFDRKFDNTKIAQFIDVDSFCKSEDGLRLMISEFLKSPKFLNKSELANARINIVTGKGSLSDHIVILCHKIKHNSRKILKLLKNRA